MAPSGSDWADSPGMAAQAIANNNERELLRRIWLEADAKPTAFVSIDTEYTPRGVCELGIATAAKHSPTTARHFIVNKNRALRRKNPKPFRFGPSEVVQYEGELLPLLVDTLAQLQAENQLVVLTGHDVQVELHNLRKCCGWEVPSQVIVLDTLHIWRSWINLPVRGSLEQALEFFDLLDNKAHLHNAGNDAKYTMELLVRKANQAVACPAPMDRTDHEVADDARARTSGAAKRYPSREPATPVPARHSAKKRKRGAAPAPEWGRGAPSPESLSELEENVPSQPREKKRRFTDVGPAPMRTAGRGASDNADIIDLTTETAAAREDRVVSGDGLIDLTGDTPPPESAGQDRLLHLQRWGYAGFMGREDNVEHLGLKQEAGLSAGQDVPAAAEKGNKGAVAAPTASSADGAGALNKEWPHEMMGMFRDICSARRQSEGAE